jgi:PKD repeat protein
VSQHDRVDFDGSGSTDNIGIIRYVWEFYYNGSTVILHGPRPSFVFDYSGMYDVVLKVVDGDFNWAMDEVQVRVLDVTPPVADAGPDLTIDQHQELQLNATGSSDDVGITEWTWSFEYRDELRSLDGQVVEFTFDDAGEFTVLLNVTDMAGNFATDTVVVIVRDITSPMAVAGGDMTIDQHQVASLNASNSTDNVGVASYIWEVDYGGTVHTLEGKVKEFTFDDAGLYTVNLNISDAAGNWATDSIDIAVVDITTPTAHAGEDLTVEAGRSCHLDGTASTDNVGVVRWTWRFDYRGGQEVLNGSKPTFVFKHKGTYTVALTVEDLAGNLASDSVDVKVVDVEVSPGRETWIAVLVIVCAIIIVAGLYLLRFRRSHGV